MTAAINNYTKDFNALLRYFGIISENVTNPVPQLEPEHKAWWTELTDRETEEVRFATLYAEEFNHGTDGHNRLNLIAKLTRLLDERYTN